MEQGAFPHLKCHDMMLALNIYYSGQETHRLHYILISSYYWNHTLSIHKLAYAEGVCVKDIGK